jgi:hypothetical protein
MSMWVAISGLIALILLELAEGKIRGNYWRVWLTRQGNPRGYLIAIGIQAAAIALILWLRYAQ